MKTQRKMLQLTLEYDDPKEAVNSLQKMIKEINISQRNFGRELHNGALIQWGITNTELGDYRVEVINGVQCIVLPSKINKS